MIKDQLDKLIFFLEKNKFDKVFSLGHKILEKNPNVPQVYNIFGLIKHNLGQFDNAVLNYKKAIAIDSSNAIFYKNLGDTLKYQGKFKESILNYNQAINLKKDFAEVYNQLGIINYNSGKIKESIENYTKAININSKFYIAYNNLGNSLQASGEIEKAIINYEKAIKIKHNFALAHRNLSTIKKYKSNDAQIKQMFSLLKKNNLSFSDHVNLDFALGKAHNDLKNFSEAFNFFRKANNLYFNKIEYDFEKNKYLFEKIKLLFSANILHITNYKKEKKSKLINPIFIIGMPRSGSTLVEQILSSHTNIVGCGELTNLEETIRKINWSDKLDFNEKLKFINNKYLSHFNKPPNGENFFTDKMPYNFRWIGFILLSFPNAKIVHTQRDPIATCWSIYRNFFVGKENNYAYDLEEIANYYKIYLDLMDFWEKKFPEKIYLLNYEKLTENPEYESKNLIKHIGLKWQNNCLNFNDNKRNIKTNSSYQVRQKIYTGSSSEWKNYEEYLKPLIKKLISYKIIN